MVTTYDKSFREIARGAKRDDREAYTFPNGRALICLRKKTILCARSRTTIGGIKRSVSMDETLAIHEAHRVLRPGGTLILNVAALEFLRGVHDCAVDADRRYTQRQLRELLTGAHFYVERLSYWNAIFTPPIALVRWLS